MLLADIVVRDKTMDTRHYLKIYPARLRLPWRRDKQRFQEQKRWHKGRLKGTPAKGVKGDCGRVYTPEQYAMYVDTICAAVLRLSPS